MKNVLHFKTTYLNPSETFIDRLVRNHVQYTPVIATAKPAAYTEGLILYPMPVDGLAGKLNQFQLSLNKSPRFLNAVIQHEQPVLLHGHFGLDAYRLLGAAQRHNLPLLVHFYGHDVRRLPEEAGWKSRYRTLAQKATHFVAVTEAMKKDVMRLGFPEDKISVIRMGIDIDAIRFIPRRKARGNLMLVGRMVEKKGMVYAIQAVKHLLHRKHTVRLHIYGDGPLRPDLIKHVQEENLQHVVTFYGNTPNTDVLRALKRQDILLVPSVLAADQDKEGLPNTVVEGLASGIPVVGTTHAGIPELIRHEETGLLVPERDPVALAEAIQRYLDEPKLVARVSRAGRQIVEQECDIEVLVRQTEALYDRVVAAYHAGV